MMKSLRSLCLILIIFLLPVDASAQEWNIGKTWHYDFDQLAVGISMDGGNFDPFALSNWGNIGIKRMIYENLLWQDEAGDVHLQMLKALEQEDDCSYLLTLWDHIKDSQGNPITADDVIWSIESFRKSGAAGAVSNLKRLEKVNETTIRWICNEPFQIGELENQLARPDIISRNAYEKNGDFAIHPIGTGPYVLEEFQPGVSLTLSVNDKYWFNDIADPTWLQKNYCQYNAQNVRLIKFFIIQNQSMRAVALETGQIDIADTLDQADVIRLSELPQFRAFSMDAASPVNMIFNCSADSVFQDVNLRKALCYAFDNEAIAMLLTLPGYPVYGIAPDVYDAPESWKKQRSYYDFDLMKANNLVSETNYSGQSVRIIYADDAGIVFDQCASALQYALMEIGIYSEIYPADINTLMRLQKDAEAWDIRLVSNGFGDYLYSRLKNLHSDGIFAQADGRNAMMVHDEKLNFLYQAICENETEDAAEKWDNYFTNEMCYGYALVGYATQSIARSDIQIVLGEHNSICVNAVSCDEK